MSEDRYRKPDNKGSYTEPVFSLVSQPSKSVESGLERLDLRASSVPASLKPDSVQADAEAQVARLQKLGLKPELEAGPLAVRNSIDGGLALWIPTGTFVMGNLSGAYNERPRRIISLDGFYMDTHPITEGQFKVFVEETHFQPSAWVSHPGRDELPVVDVNWEDAQAYCTWAQKRLPREAEWEKAARGLNGQDYPWGNVFDSSHAAILENGSVELAPVGHYKRGESPYGMLGMAGNVWEWTIDDYTDNYPINGISSEIFTEGSSVERVVRGGSWICHSSLLRCSKREHYASDYHSRFIGFRCAW